MHHDSGPKRIGYVLRRFPILSETFVLNEILALEALGVPVHIFSLGPPKDPRFHENLAKLQASITYIPDIHYLKTLLRYSKRARSHFGSTFDSTLLYVLKKRQPTFLWRFLQSAYVAEKSRRMGIDQFHAHFAARATSVASLASKMTGIPYSFTAHAYDIFKDNTNSKALSARVNDSRFVVTVSEYNKEFLNRAVNGSSQKIVMVRNGIDLNNFVPADTRPTTPFTLLAVGRLIEKKGYDVLIEACAQLRDRGLDFRCWVVGRGPRKSRLKAMIDERNLGKHVRLLGPHTQQEVLKRYRKAHLFVLPCVIGPDGNRDGLPVSIVEALACGLPVVTTPVAGISEVVRHQHNGLLVPERDPLQLAASLETLITDRYVYDGLKSNARASVEAVFDETRTAVELQQLFSGSAP
jgi:glycosyltransferase involved in cell wall biosynthesis